MSDQFYFFYQREAKSSWTLALASERANINRDFKPELNTVLDVNESFTDEVKSYEKFELRYRGPLYFDFDAEDIEEAIPNFQEFLTKLQAQGVNLNAIRLFCSGGKGFHIEVPQPIFMSKNPAHGTQALPLIYREIAHKLFVETLDLRVYSLGKGRQWRVPNVKRANGKFKVQITAEEAFDMTPEMYDTITSYARPVFPIEEQGFCGGMGLLFSTASDKVTNALKTRKGRTKAVDELKRFKGEWPETVKAILSGADLKENVGWNYICVQLAVVADSLGKTEEQLLADAEGLIETYSGDSERYGTVRKRRMELVNKFRYMQENPCYEFSAGGVLSMVTKEAQAKTDLNQGEFIADPEEDAENDGEAGGEAEGSDTADFIPNPLRMNRNGIFSRTENGWKNISHVAFIKPVELVMPSGETVGYEVDVFVDCTGRGRHALNLSSMSTKSSLHNYAQRFNAAFRGTDMDAANLIDMMRQRTRDSKKVSYVSQREGMDYIRAPDATEEDDIDVIWAAPSGVITKEECTRNYTYRALDDADSTYKTDLMNAPDLGPEDADLIANFLNINIPANMARMLGWFAATFTCPILRHHFHKFPLLQIYGSASAGKSATLSVLSHFHYYLARPVMNQASAATTFAIVRAAATSSSIPLLIEELRISKLRAAGKADMYLNQLKSNYDGHGVPRGRLGEAGKGATVTMFANTAPIAFISEEQHGDTAVQERCISVNLTATDRKGRDVSFTAVEDRPTVLGKLGKALANHVLNMDVQAFLTRFREVQQEVKGQLKEYGEAKDRPIYNLTTVKVGLELLETVLREALAETYDEVNADGLSIADKISSMHAQLNENVREYVPKNMSEPAKVLDVFAQLSKSLDVSVRLERMRDYYVDEAAGYVDVKLKPAYAKYLKYARSLGMTPVFESDAAFIGAMNRFDATLLKACPDSPLFTSVREVIYRFDLATLAAEHVEDFKA